MYNYDTVTEAVEGLRKRGYSIDFNLEFDKIICNQPEKALSLVPSEFEITEVYRFEGNTDPADEAIVFGIESKHGDKGIMVNAFGPYADGLSSEMIQKLRIRHDEVKKQ